MLFKTHTPGITLFLLIAITLYEFIHNHNTEGHSMSSNTEQNKQIRVIESYLPCTYQDGQASLRWQTKQSIELQLWINDQSRVKYFQLVKRDSTNKGLLSLVATLITAFKVQEISKKEHRKNSNFQNDDLVLLNLLEKNKFIKKPRVAKKKKYLKSKLPQILVWLNNEESLRSISSKLITADGESISYEYLRIFLIEQKL